MERTLRIHFGTVARSALKIGAYPATIFGGLILLTILLEGGLSLSYAPYAVVALLGAFVGVCERTIPYRKSWHPTTSDLTEDSLYMLLVQLALPLALAWSIVWALQRGLNEAGIVAFLWPAKWPIWVQLITKIGIGDFFRYWLHRAAHAWTPLWRLHAVHHQPSKLYAVNVFRFHPAEKILQFFCDSLPFILIGIPPEVLAYYFVFYSLSGLLQHSNCDVRLGWLNFLVSGPEVHRWHHSRQGADARANYAHSFVLWDVLFRTYHRPKDAHVAELGVADRNYPAGFWAQCAAPFLRPVPS